jgi:hypothetical protein
MKGFYKKLKGWKKFWFWVILSVILINFSQLADYTLTKTIWNYTKNNEEISLLTKIVFPAPSIIIGSKKIGFMFNFFGPISQKDLSLEEFNSFSEYRLSYKKSFNWLHRVFGGFWLIALMCIAIIIEWLYFVLWQVIIKIFIWECVIKIFIWEGLIKFFIWERILKGFIWGVLLSGWWLK